MKIIVRYLFFRNSRVSLNNGSCVVMQRKNNIALELVENPIAHFGVKWFISLLGGIIYPSLIML